MTSPFLLECLMTNPVSPHERRWVLVQSVASMEEGLRVASRMSTSYQYRLYCGPGYGYYMLDWQDDPTNAGMCIPAWVST